MNLPRVFTLPYQWSDLQTLKAGERILLSGTIYTARDAAHKRLCALLDAGEKPPFPFEGTAVFYAGPCPPPPGRPCGSIGPTTSSRMDAYAPRLMDAGLRLMIGKGPRNAETRAAMVKTGSVYLSAIGGAAALMASCVKAVTMVAFEDLGTEAIRALTVRDLPLIVSLNGSDGSV